MDIALTSYPTVRKAKAYDNFRQLLPNDKYKLAGDVITNVMHVGKQRTDNQALISGVINKEFSYVNLEIVPDQEQGTLEKFIYDN